MSDFSWANLTSRDLVLLEQGEFVNSVANYKWMVILGGFLAFAMAWGIGANDVANAFATSVGAGSLSLRNACVIAAVMEFLGAFLMGANVTDTVRKKVIKVDLFDPAQGGAANGPEILMTGFLVALISATTWLVTATYFGLPVSTTHSIIGSLVGVGLAYRGKDAVVWTTPSKQGLARIDGVVAVVVSWVVSPVLSGIIGVLVFLLVRHTVLRTKEPVRNGFLFLPFFYALAVAIVLFFIIYKGSPKFKLGDRFSVGEAIGIAVGSGAAVALLSWWLIIPQAKRFVDKWEENELRKLKNPEEPDEVENKVNQRLGKVGINFELEEDLSDDVIRMHDNVETFDPKAEQLFTWLQVFTAAFDAFAHGANDVANSIGPFASIFSLYQSRGLISTRAPDEYSKDITFRAVGDIPETSFKKGDPRQDHKPYCGKQGDQTYWSCLDEPRFPSINNNRSSGGVLLPVFDEDDPDVRDGKTCYAACEFGTYNTYRSLQQGVELWILALGGAGIVLGLAMWGYRIIVAIGVKLTKLTPSRGFSIEIGAAITVIIASRMGMPVSTTHCQVGATMGVGLVEFKGNTVNWKQFFFICVGWVFTVVLTGFVAAGIFALLINAPQTFQSTQPGLPSHCPGQNLFYYDAQAQTFKGVGCGGYNFTNPSHEPR